MKKNHFLLIVSVLILLSAIILQIKQIGDKRDRAANNINNNNSSEASGLANSDNLVGSDRDEHGCIASAGYSWCEPKAKCLRIWEEDCVLEAEDNFELNEEALDSKPLVSSPLPGETVTSPLVEIGRAHV